MAEKTIQSGEKLRQIKLELPEGLCENLEDSARKQDMDLAEFCQALIIAKMSKDIAYFAIYDKPPPTLKYDFPRYDDGGNILTPVQRLNYLTAFYASLYQGQLELEGITDDTTWH